MSNNKSNCYVTVDISTQPKPTYGVGCIICDESVQLTDEEVTAMQYGHHIHSKVCDKCKQAILHMRDCIQNKVDTSIQHSQTSEINNSSVYVIIKRELAFIDGFASDRDTVIGYINDENAAFAYVKNMNSNQKLGTCPRYIAKKIDCLTRYDE